MKLRVQSHNFSTENMIKYQTIKKRYHYDPHMHQFAELVIPRKGALTITVNGVSEKMEVGQAAFVLPFQPHSYSSEEYNELAIFVFSAALIPEICDSNSGTLQKSSVFTPERVAFSIFEEKIFDKDDFELLEIKGALYILLNSFAKTVELTRVPKYHDIAAQVVKYISEHITEKITVKNIAKAIGYTPNYVSTIVNHAFGESVVYVISAIRFEKATQLLCNTDKSCYSICYECGYGSERSFFRQFKAFVGVTPIEYRNSAKIGKNRDDGVIKYL